ncbi:MAG: kinase [Deltaproteobacteria bacterium]|nr:kinase [Deltaproteobacteria bacterium]
MIISRTPYRISFLGGGTDYPTWYRQRGGCVLAATINKYCYITVRYLPPFFEHRIRVVYSKVESCQSLDEIEHPAVREVVRYLDLRRGIEIHHDGDLPARSGMGSSSAFTVGLLHALYALRGFMPSRQQLAREGIYLEQERLRETVGSQDQVMAAHGGFNHVRFQPSGEVEVLPLPLSRSRLDALNSHLMLFYTGIKRTASNVADTYAHDMDRKEKQLNYLMQLVQEGINVLNSGQDLLQFGRLLHESWQVKRSLSSSISNQQVGEIYQEALAAGAIGGKLLGAGGGGFLLLFVHPSNAARVREKLSKLIHVPFKFEFVGSQVIFCDREEDFAELDEIRSHSAVKFQELTTLPSVLSKGA